MYDLVDRSVSILPAGSRFLLWAMRGWVSACGRGDCPPGQLAPAFIKSGTIETLSHFHITMCLLNCNGRQILNFHCVHQPQISESEAVLLRLWSEIAAGNERAALPIIELLVEMDAAASVFSAMRAVIPGLSMAGLDPVIDRPPHTADRHEGQPEHRRTHRF
ncbi:hypothetical protein [Rhizorhapis sp. SPR117]|uniref:hypothetical protein n=1 Tax=Rhizorhapis sp. SPR117 TaxID=2912611 RepID=UPI001F47D23C|nr:hypothetical protein [Rhizorhapis sp. SPR117]